MTSMYGNNMAFGLSYEASPSTGPMPTVRKSADTRLDRFHPYTVSSSGNQRNLHEAYYATVDFFQLPGANYVSAAPAQAVSYLPDCQLSGAGSLLANALYRQNYLPFHTGSQLESYPQTFDLKTLKNLCHPAAKTGNKSPDGTALGKKDRSHPFYWRKRAEPAEGMTRTRDKYRVVYTDKQRKGLENEYKTNKFITTERKAEISRKLDLSERQIKIWFQNRRAKERRDSKKSRDVEQIVSENNSEDDNNINDDFSSSLASSKFQTSCHFAENNMHAEEKTFSSGQCRFMRQSQLECIESNRLNSSKSRLIEPSDCGMPRYPVSPSEWSPYMDNCFIPPLDVSPITGNINIDSAPRI